MRTARIVEAGAAYYHVLSRVVDRRFVFDEGEKERFRKTMRQVEGFTGCEIRTYAILSNHWHVLLYVPERQEITDGELGRRMGLLYDKTVVETVLGSLARLRETGNVAAAESLKSQYTRRMYKLSEFGKMLKQRVSLSYNKRHGRKGTLWEERFKSVLLEGAGALKATAAYIDLNAVRAKLVEDPCDYRFCGYGEAMGGSAEARKGLEQVMREGDAPESWTAASARYRELLYVTGESKGLTVEGKPVRPGFSYEAVQAVLDQKGRLTLAEVLRCRVRYFTDGAILGSRAFVEDAFLRHRGHFSVKRETGARRLSGAEWGGRVCRASTAAGCDRDSRDVVTVLLVVDN